MRPDNFLFCFVLFRLFSRSRFIDHDEKVGMFEVAGSSHKGKKRCNVPPVLPDMQHQRLITDALRRHTALYTHPLPAILPVLCQRGAGVGGRTTESLRPSPACSPCLSMCLNGSTEAPEAMRDPSLHTATGLQYLPGIVRVEPHGVEKVLRAFRPLAF